MRKRFIALLVAALACIGLTLAVQASPAQAAGWIYSTAGSGPMQDDIQARMNFTYNAGAPGNWKHFYSQLKCDEAGWTVGEAVQVSGGGPYEYLGSQPCDNSWETTTGSMNNTVYSSARYIRYQFDNPGIGVTWCVWIAPRAVDTTSHGAC